MTRKRFLKRSCPAPRGDPVILQTMKWPANFVKYEPQIYRNQYYSHLQMPSVSDDDDGELVFITGNVRSNEVK